MAVPFGGHPPLSRFLEWAGQNGCTAEIIVRTHATSGQPYKSLEIKGPKGGRVALVNPDMDEHLAPSMVSYLQRRLGIQSPFPSAPEHGDPAAAVYVREDGVPLPPEVDEQN